MMIWAITEPVSGGRRIPHCDVLVWEQVSTRPSRCHEGLLQLFLEGPAYPRGEWVTFGRLLFQAATWPEMKQLLRHESVSGKQIVFVPANGQEVRR
jgi:hypothetical protein